MMAPERAGPEGAPGAGAGPRGGGAGAASAPAAPAAPAAPLFSLLTPIVQIKEGDAPGGVAAAAAQPPTPASAPAPPAAAAGDGAAPEDDDLTSLTWLQDRNLLRGMKLSPPMGEAQESPTSDFGDEGSDPSEGASSAGASPAPAAAAGAALAAPAAPAASGRHKHPQNVPYDPLVHVHSKPPYSFSILIFMAIEQSSQRALPVKEIYAWILEHFPYFKGAPAGWKNSVRHNLSLNKSFRKVEKAPNLGKGSLWMVDPLCRPALLQSLQKAPFHPQSTLERIAAIVNSPANSSPVVPRSGSASSDLTPTGRHAGRRLPDPELFPFLSRRLAASGVDIVPVAGAGGVGGEEGGGGENGGIEESNSLDDVDAAAAMLALKHGPLMLITRNDVFKSYQGQNGTDSKAKKKTRASKNTDSKEDLFPVITTSPSEDHTYSAGPTVPLPPEPSSSPDEAFGEGSTSDDSFPPPKMFVADWPIAVHCATRPSIAGAAHGEVDLEEQRKLAEGADALLNLAGITTRKRSHSGDFLATSSPSSEEEVPPPPPPKRTITTRGRKRGSMTTNGSSGSSNTRPRAQWPATGRVSKRRGVADHRRGGHGRRRGSLHHHNNNNNNSSSNNNNHIHLKPSKVSVTASQQRNDHELRRPVRYEDKSGRTRR